MDDYLDSFDEYDDIEPDESRMKAFISNSENQTNNERNIKGFIPQETLEGLRRRFGPLFFSDEFL